MSNSVSKINKIERKVNREVETSGGKSNNQKNCEVQGDFFFFSFFF